LNVRQLLKLLLLQLQNHPVLQLQQQNVLPGNHNHAILRHLNQSSISCLQLKQDAPLFHGKSLNKIAAVILTTQIVHHAVMIAEMNLRVTSKQEAHRNVIRTTEPIVQSAPIALKQQNLRLKNPAASLRG
jgi:hypothetical protein